MIPENPHSNKIRIFSDFDGTITTTDVCNEIFKKFGDFEHHFPLLVNQQITLKQYWYELFRTLPSGISINTLNSWALKNVDVDPTFLKFIEFCSTNSLSFEIVSDGFKFYIEAFLKNLGVYEQIPFFANDVVQKGNNYEPVFTFASESCFCNAGSCKRNFVLNKLRDDEILVYIGDGYSDFCLTEYSDIIFAKKVLASYCNAQKIPHYPFRSFEEIITILQKLLNDGKLKFRKQAFIARKKAFLYE
ncbi:MAG: MtnX-like HAD-IB family phosphatase [Candidatus Kapaibacteriales bacterium]